MTDKYKETKRKWAANNRDRINAKRRELRAKKRALAMENKRCLLCEFPMVSKFGGCYVARLYCNDCTQRNFIKVSRHKWKRYWQKKNYENL